MTIEKSTCAVAVSGPAPLATFDSANAMSGSAIAAAPNNVFNAIDVFIFCILCCLRYPWALHGTATVALVAATSGPVRVGDTKGCPYRHVEPRRISTRRSSSSGRTSRYTVVFAYQFAHRCDESRRFGLHLMRFTRLVE